MIKELLDLLYPPICICCERALEGKLKYLCLNCRLDLHRTNYHLLSENPIERHFYGRLKLERASSFLHFRNCSKTQKIMHELKYQGQKELGILLGEICALELLKSDFFDGMDLLVPVPMYHTKFKKRGYNQAALIAEGIAKKTGIESHSNLLMKRVNTESQTKKSRLERFENVKSSFQIDEAMQNKYEHILLIDDVITTASTLEACGLVLQDALKCKLSVLTLAATD